MSAAPGSGDAGGGHGGPWHVRGVLVDGLDAGDREVDLWVADGVVSLEAVPGARTIASRGYVLPGLVDAHCHVGLGPEGPVELEEARTQGHTDAATGALLLRDCGSPIDTRPLDDDPAMPAIVRAGRHLAVRADQPAPGATCLLAGHLLLQHRRHQRLEDPPGTADAKARVGVRQRPDDGMVVGSESGRVVIGAEQAGHGREQRVGGRAPGLAAQRAGFGTRGDEQGGGALGHPGGQPEAALVGRIRRIEPPAAQRRERAPGVESVRGRVLQDRHPSSVTHERP